jgi:hypothetical protein
MHMFEFFEFCDLRHGGVKSAKDFLWEEMDPSHHIKEKEFEMAIFKE